MELKDGLPESLQFGDGRVLLSSSSPRYQYKITDHLGNTVVFFEDKDDSGSIQDLPFDPVNSEVLQRELYYPFGHNLRGTNPIQPDPGYNYAYNGKEKIGGTGLYAYGFRYYDPLTARFTGVDPISDQFAFVSVYNYAENRVPNAIDLWGLQAFLVHGTSSDPSRWNNAKTINALQVISGNHTVNSEFDWSDLSGPFNNESSRQKAAARLSEYVMSNLQNDEDVTLIGHSHGGNVAIQAVDNIREALDAAGDNRNINLITMPSLLTGLTQLHS